MENFTLKKKTVKEENLEARCVVPLTPAVQCGRWISITYISGKLDPLIPPRQTKSELHDNKIPRVTAHLFQLVKSNSPEPDN